jgi:hypothetical protein
MKAIRILTLTLSCLAAAGAFESALAFQDYRSRPVDSREIRAGRNREYRGRPTTYQDIRESYYSRYSYYNSRPLTYSEIYRNSRLPVYRSKPVQPAQMGVQTFQNGVLSRRSLTPSEVLAATRQIKSAAPSVAPPVAPRAPQGSYYRNYARLNLIPPHQIQPTNPRPYYGMRLATPGSTQPTAPTDLRSYYGLRPAMPGTTQPAG